MNEPQSCVFLKLRAHLGIQTCFFKKKSSQVSSPSLTLCVKKFPKRLIRHLKTQEPYDFGKENLQNPQTL